MELAWRHNIMDFAFPYLIQVRWSIVLDPSSRFYTGTCVARNISWNNFRLQVVREYTSKVDKLEANEVQREKESETVEHKNIITMEPQLMITAGPGMGIPPQYAQTYAPGYAAAPNMPYQGYGM